jgi:hypothetical protein
MQQKLSHVYGTKIDRKSGSEHEII